MPPEIVALIEKPLLLAAILAAGATCGIAVARLDEMLRRAKGRAYWQARRGGSRQENKVLRGWQPLKAAPLKGTPERNTLDAADQLRIVMEAAFKPRPLLNKPERRVLEHLDRILAEDTPGWRAMGQVSLGEILASDNGEAYWAINSKRVDLLIIDSDCQPLHAVEFQGRGHHQGSAAARDAVKKEALRRAGIGYVEVKSGDTPAELRAMVRKSVELDSTA
jgi:hypothetical protein